MPDLVDIFTAVQVSSAGKPLQPVPLGMTDPDIPLQERQLLHLPCMFTRLWSSLRWQNEHKWVWWPLEVDRVALLGNSHMRGACVWIRGHYFWACPVPQVLIHHPALASGQSASRAENWLVQDIGAAEDVQQCVLDVVVLVEVSTMEGGQRSMTEA